MSTLFARVDAFDENTETWEHYTERLGHYFYANGIESGDDNAKRRLILLSVCKCNDTLEMILRGRIVCGIWDEKIQRRVLVEKALTFAKAYEIATSMEIILRKIWRCYRNRKSRRRSISRTRELYKWMERDVWMDEACSTSLLVLGVEEITVHKLAGLRN